MMRWWSIPIVAVLGWFLYTLTPFWALYDLAHAVQVGDAAYVREHVNVRTLRLALLRQLSEAIRTDGGDDAEGRRRRAVAEAATVLALPVAEALVTPQMVVDVLDDGWPQSLDLPNAPKEGMTTGGGLRIPDLRRLADFYLASEMRGFRTVVIGVPPERARAEQLRIRLRLRGFSWRLVEIDLNEAARDRIAASITRGAKLKPDANHGEMPKVESLDRP